MKAGKPDLYPLLVLILAVLGSARILVLHDVYLDDNCWLLSAHVANGLQQFLSNGFSQLQREPLGTFLYLFFLPHRLIGDYALLVWHGVTLAVQIVTPLVLYCFIRNLTNGQRDIAAFVAITFVVTALDQTAPILAAINYRIGLLLGLVSLHLTERAVRKKDTNIRKLALALIIGGIGEYIFIEGVIAFESGRLFLLWSARRQLGVPNSAAIKHALVAWIPFVAITLPLIVYKLLFKPFGVYTGLYSTGFEHFTNWPAVQEMLRLFIFGHWSLLRGFSAHGTPVTTILAIIASAVAFFVLMRIQEQRGLTRKSVSSGRQYRDKEWMEGARLVAFYGAILLLFQIIFFGFAGRFPSVGDRTTYAVLMQPGYAMIVGIGVWWFITQFLIGSLRAKPLLPNVLFALFAGVGIYYSNLNLDLYAVASKRGNEFWQAFTKRFPTLPEKADFFIDAASPPYAGSQLTFFGAEGLHGACGYELHLNLLHLGNNDATMTRRYRVVPVRTFAKTFRHHGPTILETDLRLTSNFGVDLLHPSDFIVVFYRDGELFINNEIIERYPTAPYRSWADKPPPLFSRPPEQKEK